MHHTHCLSASRPRLPIRTGTLSANLAMHTATVFQHSDCVSLRLSVVQVNRNCPSEQRAAGAAAASKFAKKLRGVWPRQNPVGMPSLWRCSLDLDLGNTALPQPCLAPQVAGHAAHPRAAGSARGPDRRAVVAGKRRYG